MLRVEVYLPGVSRSWASVPFVVDTGAAVTCLHPLDSVLRVGIDPAALARPHLWARTISLLGTGGPRVYYVQPVIYRFQHDDGHAEDRQGEIRLAEWRPDNLSVPALLGWDVLQLYRLSFDWAARAVTLE